MVLFSFIYFIQVSSKYTGIFDYVKMDNIKDLQKQSQNILMLIQ